MRAIFSLGPGSLNGNHFLQILLVHCSRKCARNDLVLFCSMA
jgi:hypothetical protein